MHPPDDFPFRWPGLSGSEGTCICDVSLKGGVPKANNGAVNSVSVPGTKGSKSPENFADVICEWPSRCLALPEDNKQAGTCRRRPPPNGRPPTAAPPVGESLRLLNEVISASRMVDLFINARPPLRPPLLSYPSIPALLAPSFAPSSDRFNDTNHGGFKSINSFKFKCMEIWNFMH